MTTNMYPSQASGSSADLNEIADLSDLSDYSEISPFVERDLLLSLLTPQTQDALNVCIYASYVIHITQN